MKIKVTKFCNRVSPTWIVQSLSFSCYEMTRRIVRNSSKLTLFQLVPKYEYPSTKSQMFQSEIRRVKTIRRKRGRRFTVSSPRVSYKLDWLRLHQPDLKVNVYCSRITFLFFLLWWKINRPNRMAINVGTRRQDHTQCQLYVEAVVIQGWNLSTNKYLLDWRIHKSTRKNLPILGSNRRKTNAVKIYYYQ